MTSKHREQLVEAIKWLSREVEDGAWAGLDIIAAWGVRDPVTKHVTFFVRVADPAGRLDGSGIEGMVQLGEGEFSFKRSDAAEHLSTLLMQDAINLAKAGQ